MVGNKSHEGHPGDPPCARVSQACAGSVPLCLVCSLWLEGVSVLSPPPPPRVSSSLFFPSSQPLPTGMFIILHIFLDSSRSMRSAGHGTPRL